MLLHRTAFKEVISGMERFFRFKFDHVIFWGLTIFFHAYTRLSILEQAGVAHFLLEIILRNTLLAMVIYFNLWYVIPTLSIRKNYVISAVLILVSLVVYALLKSIHDVYLYSSLEGQHKTYFESMFYNLSIVTFYYIFAMALHFTKEWYLQQELIRKIEVEKLHTELEYLKSQINPHFLFNSINTIYFQIDKQNQVARETLGKFSDMLRYQLYECNGSEIAIEKEINYLKNYVEIQRLRKDENYSIRFSSVETVANFSIPPLLLLPFVENAFKHVSHFSDRKNEILIRLEKTGNIFQFKVLNTKDSSSDKLSENGGIGLKNVMRRLELLYKGNYRLDVQNTFDRFEVTLEIKLNHSL